jgi:hypothetical protein
MQCLNWLNAGAEGRGLAFEVCVGKCRRYRGSVTGDLSLDFRDNEK